VDARRLVRAAGVFYGLLVLAALLWRGAWAGESLLYSGSEAAAAGLFPLRDACVGAAAAAAVIALSWVVTRRTAWGERLARALAALIGRPSVAQIAALALASGVGEEAFFRGALQPRVGLVPASLIFGLAHFIPRREFLPWTGFSIAAGFLLGALFAATGNLVAPVVAHVLVNGVNLTLLTRDYADAE
jgi:membrane protease YdiL (CAAX protease family)